MYRIALFIHILGALALFMAVGLNFLSMVRMRQATSMEQLREWAALGHQVGRIIPVTILFIIGGALYMVTTVWGWQTAWVDVALGTFLAHGVLVSAIENPRLAALHKLAKTASVGPILPAVQAQTRDPLLWTCEFVVTGTTVGMIFLMAVKPMLIGSLVAIGVTLALSLLGVLPFWRAAYRQTRTLAGTRKLSNKVAWRS